MSHPTWVRGLKYFWRKAFRQRNWSHPTWVRGLKCKVITLPISLTEVAPHVGAWIEIRERGQNRSC